MSIQFNDEPEGDGVSAGPKNHELTNSYRYAYELNYLFRWKPR